MRRKKKIKPVKDFRTLRQHFKAVAESEPAVRAFIARIIAERPDLAKQTFYVPSNGTISTVVMAGEEVFKTAKKKSNQRELSRELKILKIFKEQKVPYMPELSHVSQNGDFFGIKKMAGVTLASVKHEMTEDQFAVFAIDFGHARAKIDEALAGKKLPLSRKFNNRDDVDSVSAALELWDRPYMQETLRRVDDHMRDILTDYRERQLAGRMTYCHHDLHKWNILVDPDTKKLIGFIDPSRGYQTAFPEFEFSNMFLRIKASHDFVIAAYKSYAKTEGQRTIKPTDLAAFDTLSTFGFWHKNNDNKEPKLVERCIHNCISFLPRNKRKLPKPSSGQTP
jgi:thiamine kinase-like enzyme